MAADALQALDSAVRRLVSGKEVVVAFSGGIDSCLVAALSFGHASDASLRVSGFEGCHDIGSAASAAEAMGWDLGIVPMDDGSVLRLAGTMVRELGFDDPVMVSFELPLAHVMESCRGGCIVTGQGADEAFAGYARYEGLDAEAFAAARAEDLRRLRSTAEAEDRMAELFGCTVLRPFLDREVLDCVDSLGPEGLMPRGGERKHALREAARRVCPVAAARPKKAAQYGSGAMASLRRIAGSRGLSVGELITDLGDGARRDRLRQGGCRRMAEEPGDARRQAGA